MLAGIRMQADWLRNGPAELLEEARRLLDGPAPPRIYLTGCGDSHYAGLATRLAFERWSGIPTQAVESLELSRYELELAPAGSWAICVSNSGKVVRTVEAAAEARQRGLRAIGVTFDADSPLAPTRTRRSPTATTTPASGRERSPTSPPSARCMRWQSARPSWRQRPVEPDFSGRRGHRHVQGVRCARRAPRRGAAGRREVDFVGGGPSFGTAFFGRAKMIEAAHAPGGAHELEEWAHEEFFCTGPGVTTIVVAPPGAAHDRAVEQLSAAREIGATAVAVCPPDRAGCRRGRPSSSRSPAIPDELLARSRTASRSSCSPTTSRRREGSRCSASTRSSARR